MSWSPSKPSAQRKKIKSKSKRIRSETAHSRSSICSMKLKKVKALISATLTLKSSTGLSKTWRTTNRTLRRNTSEFAQSSAKSRINLMLPRRELIKLRRFVTSLKTTMATPRAKVWSKWVRNYRQIVSKNTNSDARIRSSRNEWPTCLDWLRTKTRLPLSSRRRHLVLRASCIE